MRVLASILAFAALAGCVAQAGPARQTPLESVAPVPEPPGVNLSWSPPSDPIALAPQDCARFAWAAQGHALPPGTNLTLRLQADGAVLGRMVGSVEPSRLALSGDDDAAGTVLVCADEAAQPASGTLALVMEAGGQTVAFSTVGIELTG